MVIDEFILTYNPIKRFQHQNDLHELTQKELFRRLQKSADTHGAVNSWFYVQYQYSIVVLYCIVYTELMCENRIVCTVGDVYSINRGTEGEGMRQQPPVFGCPIPDQIKMDEQWSADRADILVEKQTANRRRKTKLSLNPNLSVWWISCQISQRLHGGSAVFERRFLYNRV